MLLLTLFLDLIFYTFLAFVRHFMILHFIIFLLLSLLAESILLDIKKWISKMNMTNMVNMDTLLLKLPARYS